MFVYWYALKTVYMYIIHAYNIIHVLVHACVYTCKCTSIQNTYLGRVGEEGYQLSHHGLSYACKVTVQYSREKGEGNTGLTGHLGTQVLELKEERHSERDEIRKGGEGGVYSSAR